jgi:hypothetical protein
MKPNRQIRLRTFFLIFFCAAVGMTCATTPPDEVDPAASIFPIYTPQLNLYHALLYSASVATAIGLTVQARDLYKSRLPVSTRKHDLRFARILAILWRTSSASMLVVCMFAHMLLARRILKLPEHNDFFDTDIFPDTIASILVIFVLTESLARWRRTKEPRHARAWVTALSVIAGLILALVVLPNEGLVMYLVHLAVSGVEAYQPGRFQRLGAYPNPRADGFRFFWLSFGAIAILISAAAMLFFANCIRAFRKCRFASAVVFIVLLTLDVAFCVRFYTEDFPRISTDMASVGFGANWFDWTAGGVLISFLASVGAYRLSVSDNDSAERPVLLSTLNRTYVHESFWCLLLFIAAMATFYIEETRSYASMPSFFGPSGILSFLYGQLYYSSCYIRLAILALSIQLCWARWKRGDETPSLDLPGVAPAGFVCNWLALELLIVVAVPTIAIYCFAFWLGPWYLYGE